MVAATIMCLLGVTMMLAPSMGATITVEAGGSIVMEGGVAGGGGENIALAAELAQVKSDVELLKSAPLPPSPPEPAPSSEQLGPVAAFRDVNSSKMPCSAETGVDMQVITTNGWASNSGECTCNVDSCDCWYQHLQTNIGFKTDTRFRIVLEGYDYERQAPINAYAIGYTWGGETNTDDCVMHDKYGSVDSSNKISLQSYCAPGPCDNGRCVYIKVSNMGHCNVWYVVSMFSDKIKGGTVEDRKVTGFFNFKSNSNDCNSHTCSV